MHRHHQSTKARQLRRVQMVASVFTLTFASVACNSYIYQTTQKTAPACTRCLFVYVRACAESKCELVCVYMYVSVEANIQHTYIQK